MEYRFREIEKKWQAFWRSDQSFKAGNQSDKPKYYVLDMFPYPSGAGLHVGHPLGYIASDIVARYYRHQGYNVLHPMGYDSFGLPAEQYAIQTGQHPAVTTEKNIKRYRQQLDQIGFSFDWSREVRTSEPDFYRWTQWMFLKLFDSWYDTFEQRARPIEELIVHFQRFGTVELHAACGEELSLTPEEWDGFDEPTQERILQNYRLAYREESTVNWCPALGTVLANDEVRDGRSERGGHPVVQKKMMQWSLRITAYADRLLQDLEALDWPDSIKELQRHWIGRSEGASLGFEIAGHEEKIEVFTTRPDTVFGVSFMVLAPEHPLVEEITTEDQARAIQDYQEQAARKSERDRMSETRKATGVFTGAYAIHPFNGKKLPIWIGDYVLAGYGTGAVMAVPAHDARDWVFAREYGLPTPPVVEGGDVMEGAFEAKTGKIINSDFLNGLQVAEAIETAIDQIESKGLGRRRVNFRLRDAIFGRQRYWGEPIPIWYYQGIPRRVKEEHLPLELPEVSAYLPTEDGEPPLARAERWHYHPEKGLCGPDDGYPLETTTMPGWAGSSWYDLRYMDPHNEQKFASAEAQEYWQEVDLYIGGSEHATGHLLYTRFWHKFLADMGYARRAEPFKKLINQGMITGNSAFLHRVSIALSHSGSADASKPVPDVFLTEELASYWNKQGRDYELIKNQLIDEIQSILDQLAYKNGLNVAEGEDYKVVREMKTQRVRVDIGFLNEQGNLDTELYRKSTKNGRNTFFFTTNKEMKVEQVKAQSPVQREIEKMSKSKYNVVNPDQVIEEFGADTLRMYEMFLGPLEQSKPWNTAGISGVHNFLKKLWRLYFRRGEWTISDEKPTEEELKVLHTLIKKMNEDIANYSFNTSVSAFMIAVNDLQDLKCNKRAILEKLPVLISPYAPHIAEELWDRLGNPGTISYVPYPKHDEAYLLESKHKYPIQFNGKVRFTHEMPLDKDRDAIIEEVLNLDKTAQYLGGKEPRKVIVVPGKIVNIVHG